MSSGDLKMWRVTWSSDFGLKMSSVHFSFRAACGQARIVHLRESTTKPHIALVT
jgi:hypothetical protein